MTKARIKYVFKLTAPEGDVIPVEHADIDTDYEDDEDVVHQPQDAEDRFRNNVQRRNQVNEGGQQANDDSQPKHVQKSGAREKFVA